MKGTFAGFAPGRGFVLAALAFAGLLCACHARQQSAGSAVATTPASAATIAIDPCALVTRADAERILGGRVKPATRRKTVLMATGSECDYVTAAPIASVGGAWRIDLVVYDDATVNGKNSMFKSAADYYRRDMAALRSSGTTLVAVPNLGAGAWWQPGADLLHVLDHGVYIMLDVDANFHIPPGPGPQVGQQQDAAKRAAEITLMQDRILPRLANLPALSTQRPPAGGNGGNST